jgi:antitoxin component YwqK of YwqJK toxin-antitoxin module
MCTFKQQKNSYRKCSTIPLVFWQAFVYLIPLLLFSMLFSDLYAQAQTEDYMMVKNWQLPEEAVAKSEMQETNKVLLFNGAPFTGWAYELYPEGDLLMASEYKNGLQDGLSLLWYPEGIPQMSATYRNGALHGRFLGWYLNGKVIYDMYINRGTYASDNLTDQDDREQEETEILEREGSTDDGSRE